MLFRLPLPAKVKDDAMRRPVLRHPESLVGGCSSVPVAKYPAKLHASRVVDELGVGDGLVYLEGQRERNLEDSDQSVPFRQRRYFFYVAGADFPGCHVTYDVKAKRLTLWVPYVAPKDVLWFGSRPSPEECFARYDVDHVRYVDELAGYVDDFQARNPSSTIYLLHADQKPPSRQPFHSTKQFQDSLLKPAMDRARVVKTDYEIAMIRHANDISSAAHRSIASRLHTLRSERDVEAIFQEVCTLYGTRTQAYPIIAGAGANAATLHYDANDQSLVGRELLLLDAGRNAH
ncbi:Xaa-Pro dipeptidase [Ophiocordyceps camponoti-floridani]|uniref:Xaa-Pro aminopeptidase n=1 Tax=Ophiocordyceps camponoti-floridani TaxID=2030778 RepID=A0A8H4Q2G4_9HYPO|nr:Xaa-Pro dipeptidase [Ophiocordyceps camponoti-floridani]